MLERAKRTIHKHGHQSACLSCGDVRRLPYRKDTFDCVYSSYVLDLLELKDIPRALEEFWRVLRHDGRMVLVNLSKDDSPGLTRLERLYLVLPRSWVPYLQGSCRAVLVEGLVKRQGFTKVQREFVHNLTHSEIVVARKPSHRDS